MNSESVPYDKAFRMLTTHPYTGGSYALAKMILSLYNDENCYSFRECVDGRDYDIREICVEMALYYARYGEDAHLRMIGEKVCAIYPHLLEIGYAGHLAKVACSRQEPSHARNDQPEEIPDLRTLAENAGVQNDLSRNRNNDTQESRDQGVTR